MLRLRRTPVPGCVRHGPRFDVAPGNIAARGSAYPANPRMGGIGKIGRLDWVLPVTSRTNGTDVDPLWTCRRFGRKPPCRARLILSPRFRCDCSITPMKRLIDRMGRFVPPSGFEPASTVLQTVALPFKLQRRRASNHHGVWVIGPPLVRRTSVFRSFFRARPERVPQLIRNGVYALMYDGMSYIVPRRNYDIRTQCLKGTCSSSELPGRLDPMTLALEWSST